VTEVIYIRPAPLKPRWRLTPYRLDPAERDALPNRVNGKDRAGSFHYGHCKLMCGNEN